MKKILITGVNGYLGSNLAKKYFKKYEIVGLEYDTSDLFRIKDLQLEVFATENGIPEVLFKKHKIDIIIHAATFYGKNKESNSQISYSNTYLPQLLLEKAIHNGCKLFINTDTVLNRFTSNYSLTKKQFKDWLIFYTNKQLIKVINLKLEHFYGPGTSITNFITMIVQKMLRNEIDIPLTSAEQNRDFLYIDDLTEVYDLFLNNYDRFSFFNEYNVGTGVNSNLKEIIEFIKLKTNSTSNLNYGVIPYRTNELMESNNDISLIKKLGWSSKTRIKEGILKVVEFEKNNI